MPFGLGDITGITGAVGNAIYNAPDAAQDFLASRIDDIKNLTTPEGYADGLIGGSAILGGPAVAPVKLVDMVDRRLGGGGVREGFVKGTTQSGEVITPALPF